jgi:PAS domain S-box-containing protein
LAIKAGYRKDLGMTGALLPRMYLIGSLLLYFFTDIKLSIEYFYIGVFLVFIGDFISNLFILVSKRFHVEIYTVHLLEILKNLQLKYDFIVEHIPVGIYILNQSGHIEFVNNAFCALTEYEREELIGHTILKIIPHENREFIVQQIKNRIETNETTADYITEIITKSGKNISIHVSAKRTENGHPTITGCFIPVRG